MSHRRSHLQRTAKDAVFAAKLATKEGGNGGKFRVAACSSSNRENVDEEQCSINIKRAIGATSVTDSPQNGVKRKRISTTKKAKENWTCSMCSSTNSSRGKCCQICRTPQSLEAKRQPLHAVSMLERRQLPCAPLTEKGEVPPPCDENELSKNFGNEPKNHTTCGSSKTTTADMLHPIGSIEIAMESSVAVADNLAQLENYLDTNTCNGDLEKKTLQIQIEFDASMGKEEQAPLCAEGREIIADSYNQTFEAGDEESVNGGTKTHLLAPSPFTYSNKTDAALFKEKELHLQMEPICAPRISLAVETYTSQHTINERTDGAKQNDTDAALSNASQIVRSLHDSDKTMSQTSDESFQYIAQSTTQTSTLQVYPTENEVPRKHDETSPDAFFMTQMSEFEYGHQSDEDSDSSHLLTNNHSPVAADPFMQVSQLLASDSSKSVSKKYQSCISPFSKSTSSTTHTPVLLRTDSDTKVPNHSIAAADLPLSDARATYDFPMTNVLGQRDASGASNSYPFSTSVSNGSKESNMQMFIPAGKGHAIKVTEQSLIKANHIRNDTAKEGNATSVRSLAKNVLNPLVTPKFSAVETDTSFAVSKEIMNTSVLLPGDEGVSRCTLTENSFFQTGVCVASNSFPRSSVFSGSVGNCNNRSITPTFTTTGKGRTIQDNEHSLIQANRFLNDSEKKDSVSFASSLTMIPPKPQVTPKCLATGTGTPIAVSEESTRRADLLSNQAGYDRCPPETTFSAQTDASGAVSSGHHSIAFSASAGNGNDGLSKSSFLTAGKGHIIHVSQHSLVQAHRFLYDTEQNDGFSKSSFTTAGKGHAIQVTEHSLIQTHCFLNDAKKQGVMRNASLVDSLSRNPFNPLVTPKFTRAGTRASIAVSEVNIRTTDSLFGDTGADCFPCQSIDFSASAGSGNDGLSKPPFITAGKGHTIHVSEHSLVQAHRFLNDVEQNDGFRIPSFTTAGKGHTIHVSEHSLSQAHRFLNDTEQNDGFSKPSFTTAGKGHAIKVTEHSLIQAHRFLNDEKQGVMRNASLVGSLSRNPFNPLVTPKFTRAGTSTSIAVSEVSIRTTDSLFGGRRADFFPCQSIDFSASAGNGNDGLSKSSFITAGKGHTIHVSENSVVQAHRFLNDTELNDGFSKPSFTTAGKGHAIQVSEHSLVQAHSFLNDKEQNDGFSKPSFATAGKGHAIKVTEHSLIQVHRFLNDAKKQGVMRNASLADSLSRNPSNPLVTTKFSRAGTSASIAVSEVSTRTTDSLFGDTSSDCFPPLTKVFAQHDTSQAFRLYHRPDVCSTSVGDTNDGSSVPKLTIFRQDHPSDVTERSLFEANQLPTNTRRNASFENSLETPSSGLPLALFSRAGSGATITVSEESIAKSDSPLRDAGASHTSSIPTFTTAGKGCAIQVNDDSLRLADRLLHGLLHNVTSSCEDVPNYYSNSSASITPASATPLPFKFKHICGTFSGKPVSPTALSKAAGILGHYSTSVSKSAIPQILDYKLRSSVCKEQMPCSHKILEEKLLDIKTLNSSKVSLSELNDLQGKTFSHSISNLLYCGVNPVLIQINSNTASHLVFADDGLPSNFSEPTDYEEGWQVAFRASSAIEIYSNLLEQGYSTKLISKRWVANHYRWIVWSCAAMERQFPQLLRGRFCTKQKVLEKMKKRYNKELLGGIRPALRKILNRDIAASSLMILCVANISIIEDRSVSVKFEDENSLVALRKQVVSSIVKVELTDGWYSVPAMLDKGLTQLVIRGQITIGCKLAVCGAILEGVGDGIDPLDLAYYPQSQQCQVSLKLFRNSTRRARWDSKLGFCNLALGAIPIALLSTIHPDGGPVSLIDLVLCKIFPILYFENVSGGIGVKRVLTESQETLAKRNFENHYQMAIEKIVEQSEKEHEDIDEDAPNIWKSMSMSNDPQYFYNSLDDANRLTIDSWLRRRGELIHMARQKSIDRALGKEFSNRRSTPFMRAQVKILRHIPVEGAQSRYSSALLTIWEPSDDRLNLLKEGKAIRLRNVTCKPSQVGGKVQLAANSKTSLEALPAPNSAVLWNSGYEERFFSPIIRLHVISKRERFQDEFDVAGYIIDANPANDLAASRSVYVTDESGLLLRLDRHFHSEDCLAPPWKVAKYRLEGSSVYSFQNVKLTNFDTAQNCAVALWTESSTVLPSSNIRSAELTRFSKSKEGEALFRRVSRSFSYSWHPMFGKTEKLVFAVGLVVSVKLPPDNKHLEGSKSATIIIDCGSDALVRATIRLECLRGLTGWAVQDDICIFSKKLRSVGSYFSFVLKRLSHALHQGTDILMEVVTMTKTDSSTLIFSYDT